MPKYSTIHSDKFWSYFHSWFDADIWDGPQDTKLNAQRCIVSLSADKTIDMVQLAQELKSVLAKWKLGDIILFVKYTNIQWNDSPELEEELKDILKSLIEEVERGLAITI